MIVLHRDALSFQSTSVHRKASLSISFQRTLRVPDDGSDYPLPPGLDSFPVRHIDDYALNVPSEWLKRGGVIIPMWQSEALWIDFWSRHIESRDTSYPFAVLIGAGKINAITGEPWVPKLKRNPQNYLVVPGQPWLDGFCVSKDIV